jgi:hypothetical protein
MAQFSQKTLQRDRENHPGAKKMSDVAKKITQIGPSEQVSEPKPDEKPWLRQKQEPARWYMRFQIYLNLGPKRSLRKAVASEPGSQKATEGTGKNQETQKLSDMSIPGAWKRASKVWNWVERAAAYDLAQVNKDAKRVREYASSLQFSSRAYRLVQLNYCALVLQKIVESVEKVQLDSMRDYLALIARYQSVMREIDTLMQGIDVDSDSVDAHGWYTLEKEIIEHKYKQKAKNKPLSEQIDLELQKRAELDELNKKRGV